MEHTLASVPDYSIVSLSGLPLDIPNSATVNQPDVWILDSAGTENNLDIVQQFARLDGNSKIIVFSSRSNIDYVMRVLDAGATGYLTHASTAAELLDCVQAVLGGETFIAPLIATKLIASLRTAALRTVATKKLRLTLREEQIVALLRRGKTNREMAGDLDLSEKTVKHYMTILMHKLQARNRLEVVLALKDFDPSSAAPITHLFH
ncbi:MAG TPA: response regulator transcription factor [Devosia sp.]|nr:response regulator transcription factor [Devosia sp.]